MRRKLRAHTLVLALTISLIITALTASLTWLYSMQLKMYDETLINLKLSKNIDSGFNLVIANDLQMRIDDPFYATSLFGGTDDSVLLKRSTWGLYDLVACKAWFKNQLMYRSALYGYLMNEKPFAMYAADNGVILNLCGNSSLIGDCYLPKADLKAGIIDKVGFKGNSLIKGSKYSSTPYLPPIDSQLYDLNHSYMLMALNAKDGFTNVTSLQEDSFVNSFFTKPSLIKVKNNSILSQVSIKGQVIVMCPGTLHIANSAYLEDVLIYAEKIVIKSGFKGSLQAFATSQIIIEPNVYLQYPSALYLSPVNLTSERSNILLQKNATVEGLIFCDSRGDEMSDVFINDYARMKGVVYVNGRTMIDGTIEGSLISKLLTVKASSGTYDNFIFNGKINRDALSEHFTNSPFVKLSSSTGIVKWLY